MDTKSFVAFFLFVSCAYHQSLPVCGTFGPTQWLNAKQNTISTLQYGGPILDINDNDAFIPYLLYGCQPVNATGSDGSLVTFAYNAEGLVTQWQSGASSYVATYIELAPGTGTWIHTVDVKDPSQPRPVSSYVARYDANHRIVGLIISEKKKTCRTNRRKY